MAPRRTKKDRREPGPRSDDDDDARNDRTTNNVMTSIDENDNVMPAAVTNDVTDSDVVTDSDEQSAQQRKI